MKIGIIAITSGGQKLAKKIAAALPGTILQGQGVAEKFSENWSAFDGFICIMATGIVVRAIAPLLTNKRTDPCVVVLDEKANHAISLLSGHLGGGNELARQVASLTEGEAVITTASDTLGLVALDVWAREQNLVANKNVMPRATSRLVNTGRLSLYSTIEVASLPLGLYQVDRMQEADIIITNANGLGDHLVFHPRNLVLGVGCNRGTPVQEFNDALNDLFTDLELSLSAIRNLASIDKKNDEEGLLAFAKEQWPIVFFSKEEINTITNIKTSQAALKAVGAIGVAEPCALLSAGTHILLSRKRKWQNITMAVAEVPFTLSAPARDHKNI